MLEKQIELIQGDSAFVLQMIPSNSIDAIVTDPPYGLSFMGKRWDYDVPGVEVWAECLRVLKPGSHLLAFAGTRTQHRMAVRIEDAGFEIRDMIAWVYGSGFPKSLDVSKAIDKVAGVERQRTPTIPMQTGSEVGAISKNLRCAVCGKARSSGNPCTCARLEDIPATDAARQWLGWGTALKPALEPITMARKPLVGAVAANVLEHGTGALNIDDCRVGDFQNTTPSGVDRRNAALAEAGYRPGAYQMGETTPDTPPGRWPANLIHDGSEEVLAGFPGEQDGSATRFFYCAKASKRDRDEGNIHPTVKPTDLMRYLCRLVTPPGGVVLDPFMGSGSTGKAAVLEGFRFVGIEREASYLEIAKARIEHART